MTLLGKKFSSDGQNVFKLRYMMLFMTIATIFFKA